MNDFIVKIELTLRVGGGQAQAAEDAWAIVTKLVLEDDRVLAATVSEVTQ